MPTALLDFQHELVTEGGVSSLVFGKAGTTYLTTEHPQIVGGDSRFGDVDLEREDGTAFGEDYTSGKSVVFELGVDTTRAANPHVAGADALEVLESAWRDPKWREHSDAVAVLRSRAVPGRTRRCYGRPRRYEETTSRASHKGYSTAIADFALQDGKWYDDAEQSKTVQRGSLFAAPGSITVGGSQRTWPVIVLNGPLVNPIVTVGDWALGLTATISAGQSVTLDPRPWVRTMLRSDGANMAGARTASTPPLRKCYLNPGVHLFALLANSGTGNATIRWRSAWSRW